MAFLPDNLRLELKSIYDSNLVQLASYKKDVNIHLVPSDSTTHYSVITTSAHSNIDTHITLYSEDSEIEVASFSSNSINFGNDTLLRGNLVVFGSVLALGYDVLTHDERKNNFILHNYGSSAEKGVNSATEKNIAYLNNLSHTTSNSIISYILTDLANMEETLGISQLTSFQNNMFTINDFENLFAVKTLDDFNQGLSNHFIVNDEYTPSSNTKQYNTIINGSLIASNLHTNIITADALYATQFYGDASQMYNVNREHFNTNELPETPQSSNQYFTYARAGIISYSSNADISNYISSLYQSYNNLLDTQEQDTSNFIISFQSNLLANYSTYSNNFSDYLAQRTGMTEHILYTSNKNLTTYFTTSSNALINLNATSSKNISNYILNSSNIITGNTRNSVTNVQDYADNTCNILFQNLQGFLASYKNSIVQTSNASETFRASSNINTSNSISSTQKQLLFFNLQSNIDANLITNRTSNTLKTYTTTQAAQTRDYLRSTSNNIINYANTSFRILNLHKQTTSNNVLHSLRYTTTNLSNYIKSNSNHVAQTTNTTYKSMNDLIYNTSTYFNTAFQSIRDYSNLSMYNTSNTIQNVSNIILNQAATFMHQQTTDNRAFLDTMEIKFDKLMHALTTDDVPMLPQAQAKNVYYTRDLFNSSVSQQTLDNLQNAYTHSGSNSIIKNNMHNNDLTVAGKVTAHNLVVYNDAAFKISVYDTERVEIQNWSNSASAAVTFYNHSSAPANIINVMNDKNENIFLLQNNGSIGIKTANPAYTLDASAVIAGDYFHGSGKFLTNVNLVDKTTADLPEASSTSALYFRSSRVSEILATSNLQTSNFIATQIQTMHIPGHSNLILTTSNLLADMTSYANIQFSNYTTINTSNDVFTYILNAPADQWQHAIRTSNVLKEYIQAFDAGQSNYITNTTSDLGAAIKRSQTTVAYYLDLTSNNIQNFRNNQLTSQHNHISNHSNILSTRMNAIISDHSNLVSGLSNLVASLYLSNYVGATSAALTSHINSVSTYHSNFMDITSNNLVSITKINAATLLAIYNAGDLYHYSHTYDPSILHINFKDKKILNGINSDHFRIFSASESSNFIDIYPVMDNFTSISYVPNYSSLNAYAFNASPQLYVYVSNEYEIKKLMNALNSSQPIGIHFAFNSQNIENASIYSLGNTDSLNLGITITTSQVCVSIGNTEFFASTTAIMANTWYIVDIILNKTDTANISVGIYINSEVQQIYPTNTGVYANNFMYQQGDNVSMYIGKSDVKIQDFRIYSKSTIDDIIYDIHNVLFKGLNNPEYTITSNVIVDALRWVQSSNYTSNYFSPLGRYITYSGDVAIGKKDAPQATLDVYTDDPGMYSIKTNNPIWVQSATLASSDLRIKTNIRDFQPHEALNQILAIQPKTYQYIHNDKKVFGFSAQQIRSVIPNAVSLHPNSIPSINAIGVLSDNNYIKLQNNVKHNLTIPSTVALYYQDEVYQEEIEAIIDDATFKIANKSAIPNTALYVYGTIIQDFHTLDKNYIYTLNVCATQDLYRMHEALASNLDAFIFISSSEKPLIYDSQTQALYNDVSDTKDHMTSSALVIQDADKVTRRAKGMLEQIDYNLNSLNLTQALSLSTIVSTLMNDIYACENQNKPVIEENLNVFAKFNDRIQGLNTMQTDIDSINTILQKHNMK